MRLSKNDPLLVPIANSVSRTLPDFAHVDELAGSPAAAQWIAQQLGVAGLDIPHSLAYGNAQIFQQAAQIALKNMISGVGIPNGSMANSVLDVLGNFDPRASSTQFLEALAGSLEKALIDLAVPELISAIEEGLGFAINIVSNVPVVGWIVQIAWNLGQLIYKITKIKDPYEIEELGKRSIYSPAWDEVNLNSVLAQVASNDWSTLFFPPSYGKNESWKEEIYIMPLENGGVRIVGGNPSGDIDLDTGLIEDPWLGFVPGTGTLHQAIEVVNPHHVVTETGETLLPSARKQAGWVWRQATRTNSPAAFTIHCDSAETKWQSYIESLRKAIKESSLSANLKEKIFKTYNGAKDPKSGKWTPIFGWGDGSKEIEYATGPLLRTLRQRQIDFCNTLTVAYIDDSFGALQDDVVRAKAYKRQADLLEHPAVCDVDLSNVRDVLLHDEIFERRKGYNCLVYHGDKFADPSAVPPPEIIDGFASPLPDGWGQPKPSLKAALVLGAAALAAGGYYYRKDLQAMFRHIADY